MMRKKISEVRVAVNLKSLIEESKDGEWGQGEAFTDSVEMAVIRGTDFEQVRSGLSLDLPIRYIPKRIADRKALQPNDILFETAGGSKDRPTGRSVFLRESILFKLALPLTCASFSRFIRIDPTKANPEYIFWHLQYLYEAGYLLQYHTQHTGVARFQYTTFSENEPLFIPSYNTQRKIASILSAYDDLIENNTRRIQILEEMAQRLYREWFVNFRFPGHEQTKLVESELGLIPEGWGVSRLRDVCKKISYGYTASANSKSVGPKFLRITDIVPYLIDWDRVPYCEIPAEKLNKYKLEEGDIVIARTGATTGYAKRLNKRHPQSVFASYLVRIRVDQSLAKSNYIGIIVESNAYKDFIRANLSGAAQPQANAQVLTSFLILLPPQEIQSQFDSLVSALSDKREILQQKNLNLRQTRDLLLPKLISGEIDVEQLDVDTEEIAA
jgi:type I restriction enzyme, S subunit